MNKHTDANPFTPSSRAEAVIDTAIGPARLICWGDTAVLFSGADRDDHPAWTVNRVDYRARLDYQRDATGEWQQDGGGSVHRLNYDRWQDSYPSHSATLKISAAALAAVRQYFAEHPAFYWQGLQSHWEHEAHRAANELDRAEEAERKHRAELLHAREQATAAYQQQLQPHLDAALASDLGEANEDLANNADFQRGYRAGLEELRTEQTADLERMYRALKNSRVNMFSRHRAPDGNYLYGRFIAYRECFEAGDGPTATPQGIVAAA